MSKAKRLIRLENLIPDPQVRQRTQAERKRAAQIAFEAPMLFGGRDIRTHGVCAEHMLYRAMQRRHTFILLCLEDKIDERIIESVVCHGGMHGTQRMLAEWWFGLDDLTAIDAIKAGMDLTQLSVAELHRIGILSQMTYDMFYPSEIDVFMSDRETARQNVKALLAKWREIGAEP